MVTLDFHEHPLLACVLVNTFLLSLEVNQFASHLNGCSVDVLSKLSIHKVVFNRVVDVDFDLAAFQLLNYGFLFLELLEKLQRSSLSLLALLFYLEQVVGAHLQVDLVLVTILLELFVALSELFQSLVSVDLVAEKLLDCENSVVEFKIF